MAPQVASIQSFFQPEVPSSPSHSPKRPRTRKNDTGDGFSSSEVEAALHPVLRKWQPCAHYEDTDIGNLVPGPGCVTCMGRVSQLPESLVPERSLVLHNMLQEPWRSTPLIT